MMPINLGDKPLAGFSEPIEMMKDCHRRLEHFLGVLRKVTAQFSGEELTDEGRRALEASLNYFASSAPRHTADEEQSLFPRMRRCEDPVVRAVMTDLDGLEQDHRRCEASHELVDQLARQWLETGRLSKVQRKRLQAALGELSGVYAAHIQMEEQRVFPVASQILGPGPVREIGQEMRERRSLERSGTAIADSSDMRRW